MLGGVELVKNNSPNLNKNDLKNDIEQIVEIGIDKLKNFEKHPFKVVDETLEELITSITENGVTTPLIVRTLKDGNYEIVSGHRRKRACELLEITKIPCIVRDISRDEAIIQMVDSNIQREKVLPSERAFAYKMKLDAISHKGKRNDLLDITTSDRVGRKLEVTGIIGKENGDSQTQVKRYIRLTYLIPKLLEYVDNSVIRDKDKLQIALSPAVEISFLKEEEQNKLLDYMEFYQITPSHAQAIKLKEMSQNKTLTEEKMEMLLDEEKPNQTPKLKVSMNRLNSVLPQSLKNDREREEYVIKAVEFYDKYQKRMREKQNFER